MVAIAIVARINLAREGKGGVCVCTRARERMCIHPSILLRINLTYNTKCNVCDRDGNERYIIYCDEIGSDKLRAPSCALHEYAYVRNSTN